MHHCCTPRETTLLYVHHPGCTRLYLSYPPGCTRLYLSYPPGCTPGLYLRVSQECQECEEYPRFIRNVRFKAGFYVGLRPLSLPFRAESVVYSLSFLPGLRPVCYRVEVHDARHHPFHCWSRISPVSSLSDSFSLFCFREEVSAFLTFPSRSARFDDYSHPGISQTPL